MRHSTFTDNFRLKRDNDLDLEFTGMLIGEAEFESRIGRSTHVQIFVATQKRGGRKYVTAVRQWAKEGGASCRAAAHENPKEVLAWLKEDAGGVLGRTSKEAWEAACQAWSPMGDFETEGV